MRFTVKEKNGNWGLIKTSWERLRAGAVLDREVWERVYGALAKLKDYEETGLEPSQIREMDELYTEKCRELEEEKRKNRWIPIDEGKIPPKGECVLVSFGNFPFPDLGEYREDENGGAFYPADNDESFTEYGAFVNAWRPMPEGYRTKEAYEAYCGSRTIPEAYREHIMDVFLAGH